MALPTQSEKDVLNKRAGVKDSNVFVSKNKFDPKFTVLFSLLSIFFGFIGLSLAFFFEAPLFGDYSGVGSQIQNKVLIVAFVSLTIYFAMRKNERKMMIFFILTVVMIPIVFITMSFFH